MRPVDCDYLEQTHVEQELEDGEDGNVVFSPVLDLR